MLDLLGDTPAMVLTDLGEVLAQNQASVLLNGDHTGHTGDRRHVVYRWFTDPAFRAVCPPEEREYRARRLVADLRVAVGRRSGDPEADGLVDRLSAASADFRRLWAEHEVAARRVDRKILLHPRVGRVVLDCETLVTPDQRQQLVVLTPADAETRERLELLRVLGVEEFPGGTPVR
jgi:hypothetical protein